jgi:hypothetical protein
MVLGGSDPEAVPPVALLFGVFGLVVSLGLWHWPLAAANLVIVVGSSYVIARERRARGRKDPATKIEQAVARSQSPSAVQRRRSIRELLELLPGTRPRSPGRDLLTYGLLGLLEDPEPRVFNQTMAEIAATAATLDGDFVSAVVGRLATLGADPGRPQSNDALRALKQLETNLAIERTNPASRPLPRERDP